MRIASLLLISFCCTSIAQVSKPNATKLARQVVDNELRAENQDRSHWRFRLQTYKPGGAKETDDVIETKDGDLKRPLLIDGKPTKSEDANRRLEQLAHNQNELQKSRKDKNDDATRSQSLLKMLPDAFTYKYGTYRRDLVQLIFSPTQNSSLQTARPKCFTP